MLHQFLSFFFKFPSPAKISVGRKFSGLTLNNKSSDIEIKHRVAIAEQTIRSSNVVLLDKKSSVSIEIK